MQEPALAGERIVNELVERIRGSAKVEVVFGEPREIGEKTIVPVAAMAPAVAAAAVAVAVASAYSPSVSWRSLPTRPVWCLSWTGHGSSPPA